MNPQDTPPLPPGTRIGADVVQEVLGLGSYGTVYRVRSPEGSPSAVKLVPLEEDDRRAWREVELGTRLRHPNLVRHLGSRLWPEDNPRFLCVKLELIEGPTLERRCRCTGHHHQPPGSRGRVGRGCWLEWAWGWPWR